MIGILMIIAGGTYLAYMFIQIYKEKWTWDKYGITAAFISMLLLLFGGMAIT